MKWKRTYFDEEENLIFIHLYFFQVDVPEKIQMTGRKMTLSRRPLKMVSIVNCEDFNSNN